MPTRTGSARWSGTLTGGSGTMRVESGTFEATYSAASRFEDGEGTNPEELIGAAHAGCFALALAAALAHADHVATRIDVAAHVTIESTDDATEITTVHLETEAAISDIGSDEFQRFAEEAKTSCPVSRALAGAEITVEARLAG